MTAQCISEPISWLRLERYALGELAGADHTRIKVHVDECDACRTCLDGVGAHEVELPELPTLPPLPIPWWKLHGRLLFGGGFATAAVATAVALLMLGGPVGETELTLIPVAHTHIKGGDVAIELVRERDGSTAYDPSLFDPRDRFKVLFTCPPGAMWTDVFVHQDGAAVFPFDARRIDCSNRAAVPGAFRITGTGRAAVCVAFDRHEAPDRGRARSIPLIELDAVVCASVDPVTR